VQGFPGWALTGSNRRPLPCKGSSDGSRDPLRRLRINRHPLPSNGFAYSNRAHGFTVFLTVSRPLRALNAPRHTGLARLLSEARSRFGSANQEQYELDTAKAETTPRPRPQGCYPRVACDPDRVSRDREGSTKRSTVVVTGFEPVATTLRTYPTGVRRHCAAGVFRTASLWHSAVPGRHLHTVLMTFVGEVRARWPTRGQPDSRATAAGTDFDTIERKFVDDRKGFLLSEHQNDASPLDPLPCPHPRLRDAVAGGLALGVK
jgi:hypothetical protein